MILKTHAVLFALSGLLHYASAAQGTSWTCPCGHKNNGRQVRDSDEPTYLKCTKTSGGCFCGVKPCKENGHYCTQCKQPFAGRIHDHARSPFHQTVLASQSTSQPRTVGRPRPRQLEPIQLPAAGASSRSPSPIARGQPLKRPSDDEQKTQETKPLLVLDPRPVPPSVTSDPSQDQKAKRSKPNTESWMCPSCGQCMTCGTEGLTREYAIAGPEGTFECLKCKNPWTSKANGKLCMKCKCGEINHDLCGICIGEPNGELERLPCMIHCFHLDCILSSLRAGHWFCPECKNPIKKRGKWHNALYQKMWGNAFDNGGFNDIQDLEKHLNSLFHG